MLLSVGPSATPIWNQAAKSSQQLLLVNTDPQANITIGPAGVQPGDSDAQTIPPLGSLSVPATQGWYAAADQAYGPLLQVTLGGADWTPSPLGLAAAMITAGIPQEIAAAITGSGIPLIGNPQTVYDIGGVQSTGTGLIGFTIPGSAFTTGPGGNPGNYDYGLTQDQSDTKTVQIVGRGMAGNQHLTVTKKFWNPSDWSQTKNNLANYAAYGTKVIVCLKPVITSGLALGSNFTTTGTTAQQAAAAADVASLAGFLAFLAGLGFTAQTAQIVLWQEPANTQNLGGAGEVQGPIDFNNMLRTYGPTVNAAHGGVTFPLVVNVNYTGNLYHATNYANAALGLRAYAGAGAAGLPALAGLAMDWYTNSWHGGLYLDTPDGNGDSISGIADANSLPFGLNEIGCVPSQYDPAGAPYPNCTAYFTGPHGVITFMQGRLQAGKTNLDIIYYDGQGSPTGAGDLTSPIGQDPSVAAPDFRIALYQELFDTLTQQIVAPVIIAATSTVTMEPTMPSPTGGLAPVDYLSYEIAFGLMAGAASTNPFADVILTWYGFDQITKTQVPVDRVKFSVPMGTTNDPNGPAVVYGAGPMRGGYMTAKINNVDTVACSLIFFQLTGTARQRARDKWTWNINANESPVIPGFTLAAAASDSLQVGRIIGQNLTTGQTKTWLFGLAPGEVFIRLHVSGASANDVEFQLQPVPTSLWGTEDLLHEFIGAAGNIETETIIALPRAPTQLVVTNNDAATITFDFQMVQIE